ncbi:MAG TPA: alpha-hydroxy acid oxidase [Myxococcota bacterium]|nr:alpha-hydroxy-acid oxidizing protein [Myxococcales bacterium]HPG26205.1 alpha-hydroxy acid oxidase [Myxococcota bacterium]
MDLSDLEAEAKAKLDATFYDYIAGGAEDERTLADNQDAWDRMRLRPRVLRDVTTIDTSTTMLGARVSSPVAIAPMAMQHRASPDGPVATARAAQATGALFCMGLFGAGSAAQVAAVPGNAPRWLQVYVMADRARSVEAIARSAEQGYGAIVITVDVARQGNRRRDARNRWTFLQSDGQVEDPNELFDHALTFDDIAWFAERTPIPLVVKGVARGDDAKACVDAGAAGVVVSNHGGRQLDGALATADALADVVAGVDGRAEVYVDGGIRRGQHVVKALAMGAQAVFVGRPVMWGLVVADQKGVEGVMRGFQDEVERAMALCGATRVDEIDASLLAEPGWNRPRG